MALRVIILAAGKGKRMLSNLPKVMHPLGGTPLLEHVVKTARKLQPESVYTVYGNGGSIIREELNYLSVEWVEQKEQLGTGHAVLQAVPLCKDEDRVLILLGDVPLISTQTLEKLIEETPADELGLITTALKDPTGFGRIVRDREGNIQAIVEHRDASPEQLKIREVNTGIIIAPAYRLKEWLPQLKNSNKQNEYYLTDIIALAVKNGQHVKGISAECSEEVQGVNDHWQLTELERYFQLRQAKALSLSGVTLMDPTRLEIRGEVEIDSDVRIDANVILEGKVKIGAQSKIGANVILKNVIIGRGVEILPFTLIEGTEIHDGSVIGPFARIREGTLIKARAKVGNFVEIKKSILGEHSKANHLSYLGDAIIGQDVNIGAGTITCNYDGVDKWQTVIENGAFIGSNTALVAPVTIGADATVGAGSTIAKEAPAGELTITRAPQRSLKNWVSPKKRYEKEKVTS